MGRELFQNAILILSLCLSYWFIVQHWTQRRWVPQIAVGLLFGLAAVLSMRLAVTLPSGIIFDARTVVISLGALFAGPVVGAIAAIIAAIYRFWVGGAGLIVGVLTISVAFAVGLGFHYHYRERAFQLSTGRLLIFSLAVHLPAIGLFTLLPIDFVDQILLQLSLPYLTFLSMATVVAGLGFREVEKSYQFSHILDESERHNKSLFDFAEIALLEVDLSQLWRRLAQMRAAAVLDPAQYFLEHPNDLQTAIGGIRVLRVNHAGLHLLMIGSERELNQDLSRFLGPGRGQVFDALIGSMWDKRDRFRVSGVVNASDGKSFICFISLPLPESEAQARRVPVSLVDMTELQNAQGEVFEQRRRLEEIVWGTNVGTWEWQIQTNKVQLNSRWAEICGYRLQEVEPSSTGLWRQLMHPEDIAKSEGVISKVLSRELGIYDCVVRVRHKDGHFLWVHDRGRVVEWSDKGEALRMSGTRVDVTAQKKAELATERLASIRKTLLDCHKLILQERNENVLLQRLMDSLVASRGYALAWISDSSREGQFQFAPVVNAGEAVEYLEHLKLHWSSERFSRSPEALAIESQRMQMAQDQQIETGYLPWSATARRYGLRATVASPIVLDGKVVLVLNICSNEADRFDEDERYLINEFSNTLALALGNLRTVD